jgi:hypothetical protein
MSLLIALQMLMACNTGGSQTSYCEALCERAVSCEEDHRDNTSDTLYADCLAAAEAENSNCTVQSKEGVNPASSTILTQCTDALAESMGSGDCDDQTGDITKLALGAPPATCATQESALSTYTSARYAAWESSDELCGRFVSAWCSRLDTCLIADLGDIPDSVWDNLGDDAQGLCEASSGIASFSGSCTADGLYAREDSIVDVNLARQGARECLGGLDALSCDAVLSGDLPNTCAAAFTSTDQALGFASGLLDVTELVTEAVQ